MWNIYYQQASQEEDRRVRGSVLGRGKNAMLAYKIKQISNTNKITKQTKYQEQNQQWNSAFVDAEFSQKDALQALD